MNEQQFGRIIKQTLNQGLKFDPAILIKLKVARDAALAQQLVSPSPSVLVWASNTPGNGGSSPFPWSRVVFS
jgi:hypothetical protein